jgi:hypothetical protein
MQRANSEHVSQVLRDALSGQFSKTIILVWSEELGVVSTYHIVDSDRVDGVIVEKICR